jgi:hypothetical protein
VPRTSQAGLLALAGVAVAQRRLGPSSSATTPTVCSGCRSGQCYVLG